MEKDIKIIKLAKQVYSKEPIFKAAYIFSSDYYLYIDEEEDNYIIKIEYKHKHIDEYTYKEFINEVISQTVRYNIMLQTKNIRELVLGRAFASTMVNDVFKYENDDCDTNLNNILVDWFDIYDIK